MGAPAAGNTPPASQQGGSPHTGVLAAGAAGGRWSLGLGLRLGLALRLWLIPTYLLAPAPGWPPHCLLAADEGGLLGAHLALEASVIPALLPAGPRGQEAGEGEPGGQARPHFTGGGRRDCTESARQGVGWARRPPSLGRHRTAAGSGAVRRVPQREGAAHSPDAGPFRSPSTASPVPSPRAVAKRFKPAASCLRAPLLPLWTSGASPNPKGPLGSMWRGPHAAQGTWAAGCR